MSNPHLLNPTGLVRPAKGTTAAAYYAYQQGAVLQLLERARVALDAH